MLIFLSAIRKTGDCFGSRPLIFLSIFFRLLVVLLLLHPNVHDRAADEPELFFGINKKRGYALLLFC